MNPESSREEPGLLVRLGRYPTAAELEAAYGRARLLRSQETERRLLSIFTAGRKISSTDIASLAYFGSVFAFVVVLVFAGR